MKRSRWLNKMHAFYLLLVCLLSFHVFVFSQAPSIGYGGYKLFTRDSSIDKMEPVNHGGKVPATIYSNTTTFAGNDLSGSADAAGTKAGFNRPSKIAIDHFGNLYVADELNHKIRKVTPDGIVTTFAGNGHAGAENNTKGNLASFNRPAGICVDRFGNVYVADVYNHKIRKITPSGLVSNFAGSGQPGYIDDIHGQLAEFSFPVDLTIDGTGNVYVVDEGNNKIRKITPSGSVSSFAGSGAVGSLDNRIGVLATFNQPNGITVDQKGNVYVTDQLNHKIRKITAAGAVSTLAGNGQAGSADNQIGIMAGFNNPRGITVDGIGNLYVGDVGNQKIRKITQAGAVSTLAGSGGYGSMDNENGLLATFYFPDGTAIDSLGNLYVADCLNNKIRKIETKGYSISPELLPQGLHFNKATGVFSGTPIENVQNSVYTVTAYNIFGSSTANLSVSVSPQPGNALSYDGFDDRVFIPDADILKSPVVSVEFWVNIKKAGLRFGRIILKRNDLGSYDDSYSIGIDSSHHFTAAICSGSGTAAGQRFAFQKDEFSLDTWYYIAGVFRNDSMKLYVNGLLEASVYTGFPLHHGKNALSLGFDESTMSFALDEVRIFNTDRSAQIPGDMNNVLSPTTPGLVAYYNFNSGKPNGQNTGLTNVIDVTGNGNNGLLVNFDLTAGSSSNWVESFAMMSPVALEATEHTGTGFTTAWNKPRFGEVDHYLLDVSTNPMFTSFVSGYHNLELTYTSQKVSGLQHNTIYYYRVRAEKKSGSGKGAYSNTIRVKTGGANE